MAADLQRVIEVTAQAALDGSDKKTPRGAARSGGRGSRRRRRRRLSGAGGFLVGAGLVTAARLVVGSRGRELLENLEERLLEYEERHFGGDYEFDDPDEPEPESEDEYEPESEDGSSDDDEDSDEDSDEEAPRKSGSASRHSSRSS